MVCVLDDPYTMRLGLTCGAEYHLYRHIIVSLGTYNAANRGFVPSSSHLHQRENGSE
jgi:hypothetical protein